MNKHILWIIGGGIITVVFLTPLFFVDYEDYVSHLIREYPYFAPLTIIAARFIGVVLAPLPGAPAAFASMAFLPWNVAWFYNFIGVELGMITAFFIARKFRESAVASFAPLAKVHRWQEEISHRRQFWGFVGLRALSLFAFDFVSYAAGLSKLSFIYFILATFVVDIPMGLIFFYLGGLAIRYSFYLYAVFAIILVVILGLAGWRKTLQFSEISRKD